MDKAKIKQALIQLEKHHINEAEMKYEEFLTGNLLDKEDVIELAIVYLPWMVIAPLINSLAFIWDGVYIGCTATQPMKWTLLISTFIIFLPGFYLLQNVWGNHGIWLSMTLFMLARGVLQTFWAKKYIYGRLSAS